MIVGNKLYAMSDKDAIKLLTEKCKKCGHLVDDHLRPALKRKKNGDIDWHSQDGKPYVCRNCGCKIK